MQSPFFWRNLGVLLLVLANLALSVRLVQLSTMPSGAVTAGVLLRGVTLAWAMLSLLVALVAILLFCLLEIFGESRATWQRSARWSAVHNGMSEAEVIDQLGLPFQRMSSSTTSTGEEVQLQYQLHPLGAHDAAAVVLQPDTTGAMTVDYKSPDDEGWARGQSEWIPVGYTWARTRETVADATSILSFVGILLLALLTLIPFGTRSGLYSWTLYLPLLALLLALLYEGRGPRGWRYDLMLLYPAYAIILIGWLVRVVPLVRNRPG